MEDFDYIGVQKQRTLFAKFGVDFRFSMYVERFLIALPALIEPF